MSGFDSGNSQGSIARSQQLGTIVRGFGPPAPEFGVNGSIYIDANTFQLFQRRGNEIDPWGHYLFVVPSLYQGALKYYGTSAPTADLGISGDYYMQLGGWPSYGLNPIIYGPKAWTGWPELGDGPGTVIAPGKGATVLPVGLSDEGATLSDQAPSVLGVLGLLAEYVIPVPVTSADGDPVGQIGLQSTGVQINVTVNNLYTAEDQHAV